MHSLPYAKVSVNKPRRTSFCATVNPKEFLNDDTGSRRYWVVQPTRIDVSALINLDDTFMTVCILNQWSNNRNKSTCGQNNQHKILFSILSY